MRQQVIVTGVANGIGAAIARQCVAQGFTVIGCDIDSAAMANLAAELPRESFFSEVVDVGNLAALRSFFGRCAERFGALYALVNNAGLYHGKSVYQYTDDEIDQIIAVNLTALIHLSKDFAKHLEQAGRAGTIVNLTSVAGEVGSSDALYGSTKAAVIGLTKSNAMNFAPNVRVNAVSPALIRDTAIYYKIPRYRLEEYQRQETLNDPIRPDGVAKVVMFLLSDASLHLTGKVISVDNGAYPR